MPYSQVVNSYMVHSSFSIIFPLHLLYLKISSRHSPKSYLKGIATAIRAQSTDQVHHTTHEDDLSPLYSKEFLLLIFYLTIGVTLPGLLWFISVTRASCVFRLVCLRLIYTIHYSRISDVTGK
jgi:hypothetical protein